MDKRLSDYLEEYQRQASNVTFTWLPWEWEEVMNLKLEDVSAQGSFVLLWCGAGPWEGVSEEVGLPEV